MYNQLIVVYKYLLTVQFTAASRNDRFVALADTIVSQFRWVRTMADTGRLAVTPSRSQFQIDSRLLLDFVRYSIESRQLPATSRLVR